MDIGLTPWPPLSYYYYPGSSVSQMNTSTPNLDFIHGRNLTKAQVCTVSSPVSLYNKTREKLGTRLGVQACSFYVTYSLSYSHTLIQQNWNSMSYLRQPFVRCCWMTWLSTARSLEWPLSLARVQLCMLMQSHSMQPPQLFFSPN